MEHNMISIGRIYDNITFTEIGAALSLDPEKAEKVHCTFHCTFFHFAFSHK